VCPNFKNHGRTVALLALGFPGFFHLIAWGQTSAIALACLTLMFLLLRRKQNVLAGVALGFLIFKPQLGLAAAVIFAAIGSWKVMAGAILSAALELSAGVLYYGVSPLRIWFKTLANLRSLFPLLEPKPYQTHCLRTFWTMLLPWPGVASAAYALTTVVVLAGTIALWRRKPSVVLELRYSALLLATVLVSPHLTVYDLVILAPAFLLLADWLIAHGSTAHSNTPSGHAGTLLYLVYVLPLIGPLTRWTHIQLSVVAMAALFYVIWQTGEETSAFGISETGMGGAPV
jgi:hypothetical protein